MSVVLASPAARRLALGATLAYLGLYLWAIGDLSFHSWEGVMVLPTGDPWALLLRLRGPFHFEAVAIASAGPATLLVSPGNMAVGAGLGLLVGLNLAASHLAARRPQACRASPATGLLGAAPGLLAGTACCAPALLLALGVQATAGLIGLFAWMVPAAFVLLVATLLWTLRRVRRLEPAGEGG